MKSWFPEKGERWMFQIEVDGLRESGGKRYIRYHPIYMQQHGAERELDESAFLSAFQPVEGQASSVVEGSRWILLVEVANMDRQKLTVDYRHAKTSDSGDIRRMSVHVFRATFRREQAADVGDLRDGALEWAKEKRQWQTSQRIPKPGEWFMLSVKIIEAKDVEGKLRVKYFALMQQQDTAPRVLEASVFRQIFEPVDGAVHDVREGDEWFMMVEVTDYDPEEFSIWYRPITSAGAHKGGIRHLSDYIFLATFRPAK